MGRIKKGERLELLVADLFQSRGFLVRPNVPLSIAGGAADVTDIDVVALRFLSPLRRNLIVVDCKHRARAKPFERVLWTLGLSKFVEADSAIVATTSSSRPAREFAFQAGIEVLPVENLARIAASEAQGGVPYGGADPNLQARVQDLLKDKSLKDLASCLLSVRQRLVVGRPLTNLNALLGTAKSAARRSHGAGSSQEHSKGAVKLVCFEAAVVATVMLVRFCERWKFAAGDEWKSRASEELRYGDMPPGKVDEILGILFKPKPAPDLLKPAYLDEVVELLGAMLSNQGAAATLPQAMDRYLFGEVLGKRTSEELRKTPWTDDGESRLLVKRTVATLAYATETDIAFWE